MGYHAESFNIDVGLMFAAALAQPRANTAKFDMISWLKAISFTLGDDASQSFLWEKPVLEM